MKIILLRLFGAVGLFGMVIHFAPRFSYWQTHGVVQIQSSLDSLSLGVSVGTLTIIISSLVGSWFHQALESTRIEDQRSSEVDLHDDPFELSTETEGWPLKSHEFEAVRDIQIYMTP